MTGTWWVSASDLDADQATAVQDISQDASLLIQGPAGSGKTNILLLRAKWLRLKGISNYKVVVFTKTLRDFIRSGCEAYSIPPLSVVTCIQLFRELLDEYGVQFESTGHFENDRALLAGKAKSLVEQREIRDVYDCLLVDECQDYLDTELIVLRQLASRLFLAADSRQSIYKATHTPDLLAQLVQNSIVTLKYHYRSGLKLCKVADGVLRDSASFAPVYACSKYDEDSRPSSVKLQSFPDIHSQISAIMSHLPMQLDAYPGELVGVLFPKKEQVALFREAFLVSGIEPDRVRIDTMHGAKGLEFRAVHLAGCETLYRMGATQKRLIYTAILRGKTAVAIYYSGAVPGYLESAIAQLAPPKPAPQLTDLFD